MQLPLEAIAKDTCAPARKHTATPAERRHLVRVKNWPIILAADIEAIQVGGVLLVSALPSYQIELV